VTTRLLSVLLSQESVNLKSSAQLKSNFNPHKGLLPLNYKLTERSTYVYKHES